MSLISHRRRLRIARVAIAACATGATFGISATSSIGTAGATTARVAPKVTVATVLAEINAVRKKFGLPTGVATNVYRSEVVSAANQLRDPILKLIPKGVVAEDGIWGGHSSSDASTLSPQLIVDSWVYNDGWKGTETVNTGCTSPTAPACNAHRRAVLRKPPLPGAKLSIDIAIANKPVNGEAGLEIAAILSWSK